MSSPIREACCGCVNLCLTSTKEILIQTKACMQLTEVVTLQAAVIPVIELHRRSESCPVIRRFTESAIESAIGTINMTQATFQALQLPMAVAINAIDRVAQPAPQVMA